MSNHSRKHSKETISAFTKCKINIQVVVGDNKFEAVRKSLTPVHVNIVGAGEHEGSVERIIHIDKDSKMCDSHNIPFKKWPKLMVLLSLEANITRVNLLPNKCGIYKKITPITILLGSQKIDDYPATLQHRSYVHCKFKSIRLDIFKTRSVVAIKFRISNKHFGHYFVSLNTCRQIHIYQWP